MFCGHLFSNLQQYMVELCNHFPFLFKAAFPGSHSALQKMNYPWEYPWRVILSYYLHWLVRKRRGTNWWWDLLKVVWKVSGRIQKKTHLQWLPAPAQPTFYSLILCRDSACEPNWGRRVIIQGKIEKAEFNQTNWLIHQGTVQGKLSWLSQQSAKLNFLMLIWATAKVWKSVRNPGKSQTGILCWRCF